jgi:hypothetical protein
MGLEGFPPGFPLIRRNNRLQFRRRDPAAGRFRVAGCLDKVVVRKREPAPSFTTSPCAARRRRSGRQLRSFPPSGRQLLALRGRQAQGNALPDLAYRPDAIGQTRLLDVATVLQQVQLTPQRYKLSRALGKNAAQQPDMRLTIVRAKQQDIFQRAAPGW